jgi:hypothetical protein
MHFNIYNVFYSHVSADIPAIFRDKWLQDNTG